MIKRLFDLACSAIGLVILSPILGLIAVWIKLEDDGPILYRGTRVGRFGHPFQMLKFRTMVVNAEQLGGPSTADHDPRITRCGRWLRKYKLDEFPQLINVLRGEMSIVGPRPEVPFYVNQFTDEEKVILSVRPGITDYATLWNSDEGVVLAGSADPERAYAEKIRPEKIRLQLVYVRNRSFMVDLGIIAQTMLTILTRRRPQALHAAD
jgi:lipopolysaccharide/colanic/teichoic acid biosynthesis glycosyltransferase